MKLFAIAFFVVALLASIAFSAPVDNEYCKDIKDFLNFNKPMDGDIYKINSTQIVELEVNGYCYDKYGKDVKVTIEVFSKGKQAVVDTIVEQEYLYELPQHLTFLIDKVWANDDAKYFLIGTIFKEYDHVIVSNSGTFTTVDKKKDY